MTGQYSDTNWSAYLKRIRERTITTCPARCSQVQVQENLQKDCWVSCMKITRSVSNGLMKAN
ncbi:DUF2150 family protein [Candidatus Woesearchaeota archaeon]|nr:DUF2150 family protein [Candidatus Woesearchaeota archaeon]